MSIDKEIEQTLYQLGRGGIIIYPTDTVWGLGCDATNRKAVQKIFTLKRREESKSLVVLVSSLEMLKDYVTEIPLKALEVMETTQSPTTIIYENPIGIASNALASDNTIAIRIPDHDFCKRLIRVFGKPVISTSANISGHPTPLSFSEIDPAILEGADYIVHLEREKTADKSSSILKVVGDDIQIIRP